MNSSINETSIEASLIGKLPAIQYMYVCLLIPLSLIAVGFNITILMVLKSKEFKAKTFFDYFQLNVINSIILSLVITTSFVGLTKNIFEFTNSYAASFYFCYIYTPLLSTFYMTNSLLEICIVYERCVYFMPSKYNKLKLIHFKKLGILVFLISFLVSFPVFFLVNPGYTDFQTDVNETFCFYFWRISNLSMSSFGKIVTYLMYFFRDILPLIFKLGLNLGSVLLIRGYKKRLEKEKLAFAFKISNPSANHIKEFTNEQCYISRTDRNQTCIAIIVSAFSLFKHAFYIFSYVLLSMEWLEMFNIFFFLALICLTLKHISNFFILYKFSYLFRTKLKKVYTKAF